MSLNEENEVKILVRKIVQQLRNNSTRTSSSPQINEKLLPHTIIWDPLGNDIELVYCPHCFTDLKTKVYLSKTNEWTEYQDNSHIPRSIWGSTWFVLLIGRMYECENIHKIISYHSGVLNQMDFNKLPFILSYTSGMTTHLFDMVIRLVEAGNSFTSIQRILKEHYLDEYFRRKIKLDSCYPLSQTDIKLCSPSVPTLVNCFRFHFLLNKNLYDRHFSEIKCQSLSIDHTFKVAANIGCLNDGRWHKLYNSLFIAMNEKGLAKSFRFTKGTSFESVSDILQSLKEENDSLQYISVDNCCQVRQTLQAYFPIAEVKLDLFHAIQRLTKHMPKRHPFYFEAVKSIGMIFRNDGDLVTVRKMETADKNKMLANLDAYLEKWINIKYGQWKIVNSQVEKEFRKLRSHIEKGCLSNIPVGMGTNQNESLHKHLKQFGRSRMSLMNAEAIVTCVLFASNMKKCGQNIVPPIWSIYPPALLTEGSSSSNLRQPTSEEILNNEDIFQESHLSSEDVSELMNIFSLASCLYKTNSIIPKHMKEKLYRFQGCASILSLEMETCMFFDKCYRAKELAMDVLKSLLLVNSNLVVGSENASLLSILLEILNENYLFYSEIKTHVDSLIDLKTEGKENLQKLLFDELIINRTEDYDIELNSFGMIEDISSKREFYGIILKAFTNIFHVIVNVIPLVHDLPVLPIIPNFNPLNIPFFILFDPIKSSFSAVYHCRKLVYENSIICYCGQKQKIDKPAPSCSNNYRCSCLKAGKSCSVKCRCNSCLNNKPEKSELPTKRRKRIPHNTNALLSPNTSDLSCRDVPARLHLAQHFILESITYFLLKENLQSFSNLDSLVNFSEDVYQKYLSFMEELRQCHLAFEGIDLCSLEIQKTEIYDWLVKRKKRCDLMLQLI